MNNKYMVNVRNKFDTPQELSETLTSNEEYEHFVNAHMKAAAKCVPISPRVKC